MFGVGKIFKDGRCSPDDALQRVQLSHGDLLRTFHHFLQAFLVCQSRVAAGQKTLDSAAVEVTEYFGGHPFCNKLQMKFGKAAKEL